MRSRVTLRIESEEADGQWDERVFYTSISDDISVSLDRENEGPYGLDQGVLPLGYCVRNQNSDHKVTLRMRRPTAVETRIVNPVG
jgi:hypothetical protein